MTTAGGTFSEHGSTVYLKFAFDLKQRAPNVRIHYLGPRGANITNSACARLGYGLSVIDLCYTHVAKPYRLSRFSLFAITVCILIFGRSPIGDLGDFSNSRTTSSLRRIPYSSRYGRL